MTEACTSVWFMLGMALVMKSESHRLGNIVFRSSRNCLMLAFLVFQTAGVMNT